MQAFIKKHTSKIPGKISYFDRVVFKGYLPISWLESMQRFFWLKEFNSMSGITGNLLFTISLFLFQKVIRLNTGLP